MMSIHLSQCAKQIMAQVGTILLELGEISGENIFIDGTRNSYSKTDGFLSYSYIFNKKINYRI
ncbi:hypothetical protein bpr_I1966 [Butyrivibrio proteoclasticus B316]|uniref:Uncharacterized protein n=2 Tax=Butyrivibrio proteoclasticus TaxID=43305 RepID=E0RXX4_BUTPB|nr:hypothetical protein bpr_I1966 [Butyrivibrio proteoclasticus B316]